MRARLILLLISTVLPLYAAQSVCAQDITRLGGDLTSDLPATVSLQLPAPNITSQERFQKHLSGHGGFHRSFETVEVDGEPILGPRFNHFACGGCHINDGRGEIRFGKKKRGSGMLIKVGVRGQGEHGEPRELPGIGSQLRDHDLNGGTDYSITLAWKKVRGRYPDGTRYILRKPQLSFKVPGRSPKKIVSSLRMTPPVIGMGLLEAVPTETIIGMSDPDDLNGDGISGRVSLVPNVRTGSLDLGRFGFRASHPTVEQQNAAAFFHDMGLTNELFSEQGVDQEISAELLEEVTFYLQVAGVTYARDQEDPDVSAGKELFKEINCSGCHVVTLTTGTAKHPELNNQEIHPFTDLLLHDMGPGLADTRPEFSANSREWRTTPLWGLGLYGQLSRFRPGFLHDGRARTIEEAILWHGGEAEQSRNAFKNLAKTEREQLLKFLESL